MWLRKIIRKIMNEKGLFDINEKLVQKQEEKILLQCYALGKQVRKMFI